jgi:uncharacterized repeat protein (TIGR02543 family)
MPKTFIKKSTGWTEIKSIFVKKTTGWAEVKNVFVKKLVSNVPTWVKVFTKLSLPDTTTAPSIRTTNTSGVGDQYDGPLAESPQFLNTNLFGKDGVYTNFTSKFGRKFTKADAAAALPAERLTVVTGDLFNSAGGVTESDRISLDNKYLFFELSVQNGSTANQIQSVSSPVKMIKRQPALDTSFTTSLTGQAAPGETLTLNYYLKNNYYDKVIPGTSKIKWWRSTDNTASGTLVKEETITDTIIENGTSVLRGQSTYNIATSADNGFYIVVEIVGVSSWTEHNSYTNGYQIAKRNSSIVQGVYRFQFGNTLYVSSNGHIGLDTSTNASAFNTHSSGRSISIFLYDLTQYYLAEYSDEDVYYLYSKGYLQGTSAASSNALDYQIKFYKDPAINYCDVKMIRYGSNVPFSPTATQGFYESGLSGHSGIVGPYYIGAGSTFRVFFDDTPADTGVLWTAIDDAYWDVIQTWTSPGVDDTFTTVVTATNQSAPLPTTPTSLSSAISVNNEIVLTYSGGTGDQYDVFFANEDSRPTDKQAFADYPNEPSPFTVTALSSFRGVTRYFWVRKSTGTLRSNWFPAGTGVTARIPLFAPPAPVITNSAKTATSLSWHWTKPTPSASQDEPTSWDYALTQSTSIPSTWTNITTLPTAQSPLVISSLTSNTDYYLHVKAKNADSSTLAASVNAKTNVSTVTPTSLTATTDDSSKITLTWSGGSGDTYLLYWLTGVNSWPVATFTGSDFTDTESPYEWTGMTRGTTYYFFVKARSGTSPNFTYGANWYPAQTTGIVGKAPLFAPAAPVITNSAQSLNSLSWHWTKPTPSTSQDEATSWDYALTQSTSTPSTWTNITTLPTSASPLVTSSLTSGTDYYLHVKAKNADSSTLATAVLGKTTSTKVPPTLNSVTLDAAVGGNRKLSVAFTAVTGSGPAYQIYWYSSATKPSVVSSPDGSGTTSPIIDTTGPTSIGRWYAYIRSAATTTTTGTVAPSTTLSDWSDGVSFDISGTRTLSYDDNTTDTTASIPEATSGTDPWDGWDTTVSGNTPTRTGYTFSGWNTSTDGLGTSYAKSADITVTSNLTLYAKWTANTYSITYDGNGNTSGSVPDSQTKTYGTNLTLRSNTNTLAKTDFSFGGWNTKADGTGTSYAAGGSYSANAAATLYARWIVPFTTPSWNGTMPAWAANSPFVNGNNFRRLSSSLQYGWNNGTFSFSGSVRGTASADRGWDFYASTTNPGSTTATRTPTHNRPYTTDDQPGLIGTTAFKYRVNPTYDAASVYGSIRPYAYGTDNNKYVRGAQPNGTWSGSI